MYRKIKTISINICDKFWTIFSIDENNRLLIARQICLLIGETLRSFLSQFFSLMSLVDGVVHRLTCTKNRSACPGMVDKPLCSIRQVTVR